MDKEHNITFQLLERSNINQYRDCVIYLQNEPLQIHEETACCLFVNTCKLHNLLLSRMIFLLRLIVFNTNGQNQIYLMSEFVCILIKCYLIKHTFVYTIVGDTSAFVYKNNSMKISSQKLTHMKNANCYKECYLLFRFSTIPVKLGSK